MKTLLPLENTTLKDEKEVEKEIKSSIVGVIIDEGTEELKQALKNVCILEFDYIGSTLNLFSFLLGKYGTRYYMTIKKSIKEAIKTALNKRGVEV